MRLAMAALTLAIGCSSDSSTTAPTLEDLTGEWIVSWTESGTDITCEHVQATLDIREPGSDPQATLGGGAHSCEIEGDVHSGLIIYYGAITEFTIDNGLITIAFANSTMRFTGRVTSSRMSGQTHSEDYWGFAGAPVEITGTWTARRAQ
jgi:hypothetical protein